MKFPVQLSIGKVNQYSRDTLLVQLFKHIVRIVLIIFILFLIYKFIPNPYLCYEYKPKKISDRPIEFIWTGESYQCRFDIANSGFLAVKKPLLFLSFVDGATIRLDSQNNEWQKNDDVNYFWTKDVTIYGGVAERAWCINVIFHKSGINRIKYFIKSNGVPKTGVIKVINNHYESPK